MLILGVVRSSPYAGVRGICPQLAQPWWYRHAHSGLFIILKTREDHAEPSTPAKKAMRRNARRRGRKRDPNEFARAFGFAR